MNLLKKSELLLLREQSLLPAIPMPTPFSSSSQKIEKNALDRKESDFIKRLKKTKSIMIAQKNRKQKNILNPHFMDMRKRKSIESFNTKNNCSVVTNPKNLQTIYQKQEQLQKKLFPPVHSSIQICLNTCKKIKSKQLKLQTSLHQPFNIGQDLIQKVKLRNGRSIAGIVREQKDNENKKKNQDVETERQNLNYTEIREESENCYKSLKKLDSVKAPYHKVKVNRKQFKYYRNLTEESKMPIENERLGGWEFRNIQDEAEML